MTMGDIPTPSSGNSDSSLRPRPLNFSRPRPTQVDSKQKIYHDNSGDSTSTKSISAFHDQDRDLPQEPRFSIDSQQTASTRSENSAASEFAWDGQLGELRSRRRPDEYEQNQRYSKIPYSRSGTSNSGGSSSTAMGSVQSLVSELPGSRPPPILQKFPKIVKRTSVEQQSDRVSMSSRGTWEDNASHHTMSVDGDAEGEYIPEEGKWSSSAYDISGLSAAELKKLRKKGINPALYAEMKAARKGKGKWVGPLVGNTFIG